MDVCPVQALDMTRPDRPGAEAGGGAGQPEPWMMEFPVQVGECIGCEVCISECPVQVMTLDRVQGATPLLPRQGPIHHALAAATGLGAVLRRHPRVAQAEPSGAVEPYAGASPIAPSRGRRGATAPERRDPVAPARRLPGGHRRWPLRRTHRRRPLRRRLRRRRRGQPLPLGLRLDLHGPLRGCLPPRYARRADLDPDAQAVRRGTRAPAAGPAPAGSAPNGWPSSAAARPACPPPTSSRGSAIR